MTCQQLRVDPRRVVDRPATSQWIDLGYGVRLQLNQFEDGWGWSAWERITANGWRALPAPSAEDVARRFSVLPRAEIFFHRLMLLTLTHTPHGER